MTIALNIHATPKVTIDRIQVHPKRNPTTYCELLYDMYLELYRVPKPKNEINHPIRHVHGKTTHWDYKYYIKYKNVDVMHYR